ncbi:TadE/TadG family type IV pilus assembly protein [Caballeronia sp. ATUFL_M2_KS44]|uniref:TadE/TadG family type IV pilus assembly protein n=1 Tax=Caballeronia sp. ATUFL_M2_KS44 TaxID=2921767 RepID=UPI002029144F|nr:TadE/TadG family type IV pilus assembly protein [Caballeronia sp. ATUFL_M2_KS44]
MARRFAQWFGAMRAMRAMLRSDRGSVSIEFVVVVPLMLLVLLGFTEMYMYMRAVSAVDRTAFTVANMLGQMTSVIVDDTDSTDANSTASIWRAAALIAAPYQLNGNGMVYVTSVCDSLPCAYMDKSNPMKAGAPTISWSASPSGWTKNTGMASQVSKTNLLPVKWPFRTGDSAVIVEVFLSYNPFTMTSNFMSGLPGQQIIYRRVYVRTRTNSPLAKQ